MKKLFYSLTAGSVLVMLVVFMQSCKQDFSAQPTPTVENTTRGVSDLKLDNVTVVRKNPAYRIA